MNKPSRHGFRMLALGLVLTSAGVQQLWGWAAVAIFGGVILILAGTQFIKEDQAKVDLDYIRSKIEQEDNEAQ